MAWHWKQAIRHDVTEREENPFLNFCAVETRKSAEKLAWCHCLVPRRLSISKKICTQRKAGRVKRHPSFLLPMVPCASSPVTRVLRYALSHEVPEEKAVPEWSFPTDGLFSLFSQKVQENKGESSGQSQVNAPFLKRWRLVHLPTVLSAWKP